MQFAIPTLNSTDFFFKNNCFVTEASDLQYFALGRVYEDACDMSFGIRFHVTGKIAIFVESHTDTQEGDIMGWHFKCTSPGLCHLKALIIND